MLTILCTVFLISGTKSGMAQTQELAANEQAGDQDQSATELAKQATNPLSSGWLMQTQQNNNWVGMPLNWEIESRAICCFSRS
jgi:hypothetical protein